MTSVGIETRLLRNPRTGIGNYSLQLLIAILSKSADVQYHGFSFRAPFSGRWSSTDLNWLQQIEAEPRPDNSRPLSASDKLVKEINMLARRFSVAKSAYRLSQGTIFSQSAKRQKIDFFHALNFIPPGNVALPVLPTIYDLSFLQYPETHPVERRRWLERLPGIIKTAPFILTISEFSRREIATTFGYPPEKIIVAPPAAASIFRKQGPETTQNDLTKFGLRQNGYFLTVGTLEPRKNLKTLIKAYSQTPKNKRAIFPLVIVGINGWGDLSLPDEASSLIQEGSLRFCGGISDELLRSLYEGAQALLFPSIYEGFGMPVVEAMSCGTPVAHSSDTAMDEISGKLGVRLPALDVDAWAWNISVMTNPDWRDQFDTHQLIAQSGKFNWHTSAASVLSVYEQLGKY